MATTSKGRKRVTFKIDAEPGSTVAVAGTFNDWNPTKKLLKQKTDDGRFEGTAMLDQGRHEYKFVINDTWCADPNSHEVVYNEYGSTNSVVVVGKFTPILSTSLLNGLGAPRMRGAPFLRPGSARWRLLRCNLNQKSQHGLNVCFLLYPRNDGRLEEWNDGDAYTC
jgi:hypothetical protein